MAELLTAFLREAAGAPFAYGSWDCAMTVANWIRARTGADPAAEFRDRYSTVEAWQAIVECEGGLVPIFDRLWLAAGLVRVTDPIVGDVGVVPRPVGCAGGIRGASGWLVKTPSGLGKRHTNAIAAWGWR